MNIFRTLIIGLFAGGAFGAKIGAYATQVIGHQTYDLISSGMGTGALAGLIISVSVLCIKISKTQHTSRLTSRWFGADTSWPEKVRSSISPS